jgi:hypothetical protein
MVDGAVEDAGAPLPLLRGRPPSGAIEEEGAVSEYCRSAIDAYIRALHT